MGRIFELDAQLLFDSAIVAINVFILFTVFSYLLFEPVRNMLDKRRNKIQADIDTALQDKEDAAALKAQYDDKLRQIDKEAEAEKIRERARKEMELEKKQAIDDMKKEMIEVATLIAGKVVSGNIDVKVQEKLVDDTLQEIGDSTWQN